jgi:hypothetical protein
MIERRTRRSRNEGEALRLLLEAVRERSEVTSIAIVDARGRVVSGAGPEDELEVLGTVAAPAAHGFMNRAFDRMTEGTDVLARAIDTQTGTLYLAALGTRVSRMVDAARGVERILRRAG